MRERPTEVFFNIAVGIASVALVALIARRELAPPRLTTVAANTTGSPIFLANWEQALPLQRRIGAGDGRVQIVEFVDYECPFCRSFEDRSRKILDAFPEAVTFSYVHLPLSIHRFSRSAAVAAECASRMGRFRAMHAQLMAKQDSLGLKPYSQLAWEAGIQDTVQFKLCTTSADATRAVAEDVALAESIGISATPTIVINGWKFANPPSEAELTRVIRAIAGGEQWAPEKGDTVTVLVRVSQP